MITQIENAVAAFVTARFAAADPVITAEVRVATNKSQLPVGRSVVVVKCTGPDTTSRLQLAKVEIIVSSPARVAGITVASHGALERAVTDIFVPANLAHMATAVTDQVPGHQSGGYVCEGWKDGREDTAWQPVFSLLLGVVPTA